METALGASMQNVVVATEDDGKAAIRYLKRCDGGRATFLPMNTIQGRTLQERGLEDCTGFVGIAAPHIARMLFRSADHRILLPATILSGVVMMLVGDILSKYFVLPINTITALMGIPIVVYIVTRRR
jgi:hypothetical protein